MTSPTAKPTTEIMQKLPNVIAVASGKGGVGKTWFSITLAHQLAAKGKNVLLFDGDLGLANVDIQLGLMPKVDISSYLTGQIKLQDAITKYTEGGFDILAGRSGTGSLASLPQPRLNALRQAIVELSPQYDTIIIDLGAGIDKTVRSLAIQAGTSLIITNDEPTSLTDAYAFIKMTHADAPNCDNRILVNMAKSRNDGERTYQTLLKACENFLKISPPLAGIIRQDRRIAESIRNQISVLKRYPNSELSEDIERIAKVLLTD